MAVYFMQSVDGGPIKIGHSVDVERRRTELEEAYGTRLVVLATLEGDKEAETGIHAQFSHLRFGRTEQFRPASDLLAFIGRPLLVNENPDAVEAMPLVGKAPLFSIKGRPSWHAWLKEFAELLDRDAIGAIDEALREHAKTRGFKPMPKRIG